MTLKATLQDAMKSAMKEKQKERLGAIRMILADIKKVEVDERIDITDDRVLAILDKMQKQRRDSIQQFEAAGRDDLAAIEKAELEVISDFLPEALTQEELSAMIDEAVTETGAASMADMGKVMAIIKPKAQGRADMSEISKAVKSRLS